eukprot:5824418-Lingulodinium_polyedra.AAC.1
MCIRDRRGGAGRGHGVGSNGRNRGGRPGRLRVGRGRGLVAPDALARSQRLDGRLAHGRCA